MDDDRGIRRGRSAVVPTGAVCGDRPRCHWRMGFLARTAIHGIHGVLERGRSVIVGDFNDGPHFDSDYGRSFARTSELLGSAGYRNLYNARAGEAYGAETAATVTSLELV